MLKSFRTSRYKIKKLKNNHNASPTLVYLKALATVQGSGYSFKKTWLQSKMADLPESYTTNAHFTEVTLSMPI